MKKPRDVIRQLLSRREVRDLVMSKIEAVVGGEPPTEYLQYQQLAERLHKTDPVRMSYEFEIKSVVFRSYYDRAVMEAELICEKDMTTTTTMMEMFTAPTSLRQSDGLARVSISSS